MENHHFQLEIHLQGVNCPFAMLVYQSATTLPQHSASRSCCGAACDGCRVSVALAFPKGCFRFAEKIGTKHLKNPIRSRFPEHNSKRISESSCRKKPFPCCACPCCDSCCDCACPCCDLSSDAVASADDHGPGHMDTCHG